MLFLTLLAVLMSGAVEPPITAPDLILATFSGRSGALGLGSCTPGACPPRDNIDYLASSEGAGTAQALEQALRRSDTWTQAQGRALNRQLRELELPDPAELGSFSSEQLGRSLTERLEETVAVLRREPNLFRDETVNVRADGGQRGLFVYQATSEDHTEVIQPGSEALCWLQEALLALEQGREVEVSNSNVGCVMEVGSGAATASYTLKRGSCDKRTRVLRSKRRNSHQFSTGRSSPTAPLSEATLSRFN